jgi:hypothetical protein
MFDEVEDPLAELVADFGVGQNAEQIAASEAEDADLCWRSLKIEHF